MKVVDCSAIIDALTHAERGARLRATLDDELFAPDLLVSEVLAFARRKQFDKRLTAAQADSLVANFLAVPIEYLHVWPYAEQVWRWRVGNRVSNTGFKRERCGEYQDDL